MSDDKTVFSRRRVLAMLGSEFAKMAALTAIGGSAGAIISYTNLNGSATLAARRETQKILEENPSVAGIFTKEQIFDIAKQIYSKDIPKGVTHGTIIGGAVGNILYENVCGIPAPEPDIY